jgi:hypothetical protein
MSKSDKFVWNGQKGIPSSTIKKPEKHDPKSAKGSTNKSKLNVSKK